jgi:circadian clock protein KaiC
LEMHLAMMHRTIEKLTPALVVVDPISSLLNSGTRRETNAMFVRLIDYLKSGGITAFMTALTSGNRLDETDVEVSSIVDTWLWLRNLETEGQRIRALYVLKSRGMAHSNQVREFELTNEGIKLLDFRFGGATRNRADARDATTPARIYETETEGRFNGPPTARREQ